MLLICEPRLLETSLEHAVHLDRLLLVVAEARALLEARRARAPEVHVHPEYTQMGHFIVFHVFDSKRKTQSRYSHYWI